MSSRNYRKAKTTKDTENTKNLSDLSALSGLPKGWSWAKLGNVCEKIIGGGTPSTKNEEYWKGKIPWITSADIYGVKNIKPRKSINQKAINESATNLLPKGNIVVVTRVGLGKLAINDFDLCFSQDSQGLILNRGIVDTEFLAIILSKAVQSFKATSRGTTISGVTKKQLKELLIPLPPLPEQHRIVEKIEELFSELDNGIDNLKKAKAQIKTYRQAVLKFAFEGRLTTKDTQNTQKLSDLSALSGLPKGWNKVKFKNFVQLQRGYDLPLKNIVQGEYPVITSSGIKGFHNEFKAEGPILVTGRSGSVGSTHYFEYKKYWPHNTVLFVKDFLGNYPKFIYYFFLQFNFKSFSASTAVPTLDRKQLYNEPIFQPPYDQQTQIVEEIERRFSVADKMEVAIDESLKKSEALRQSILKQAFEGKLVQNSAL